MRSKVHPTYKTKHRVANWAAYNQTLVRRGDVTVWLSSEAIAAWTPRRSGRRGGQRRYSDLAIETALTLRDRHCQLGLLLAELPHAQLPRIRFPPEIISHAVWLYHRFALSFRDVEDVLARRGVDVTYEAIRKWCRRFGPEYAGRLRRRRGRLGDTWHLDEVFVTIQGRQQYLWRVVDEAGDVLDILVQPRRNRHAAVRFFRKLLKNQRHVPRRLDHGVVA